MTVQLTMSDNHAKVVYDTLLQEYSALREREQEMEGAADVTIAALDVVTDNLGPLLTANLQPEMDRLIEAANDYELEVLCKLRLKAGITWDCKRMGRYGQQVCWTNMATRTTCEHCGKARPNSTGQ